MWVNDPGKELKNPLLERVCRGSLGVNYIGGLHCLLQRITGARLTPRRALPSTHKVSYVEITNDYLIPTLIKKVPSL